MEPEWCEVVVVGAGMAGLVAARALSGAGRRVAVYDKANGVGGRMATRRLGDALFDLGAQYFTARDPLFQAMVDGWVEAGIVWSWSTGFSDTEGVVHDNGEPRYVGVHGMTTVPKRLTEGLAVHLNAAVLDVSWGEAGAWVVRFRERPPVHAGALVLTPPVPLSLELLAAGGVDLDPAISEALARIEYEPCLSALVRLTGPSALPAPGGLWLSGEPVRWMGDNTQKGISESRLGASVTVHAGPGFSREYWDVDPDVTGVRLASEVAGWLGSEVAGVRVHKWRHATPVVLHPERFLWTDVPGPLVFAGDAFGGPRVEGAALSGQAAAEALLAALGGSDPGLGSEGGEIPA